MKDELFADLLASAEEMVRIEKGEQTPAPEHVHTFSPIDVKAIREATGLKQQEFAIAVGVSYDLVKSWETRRRQPTGASRKLLILLQTNPFIINQLKAI
ncbi:helix-turn-helix domain-containing protein [Shimwellia pseudoproteus]|uniref:NadS family protein n=1 Tax=Shimwellia pseudoproteus TaxID=570012 RepID=UPI0018EBB7EC|nr:NadS family protein [Shimwellia pseudoproteus]MBJ3816844.1 helix-turn-helix domain-containing protein [Shimwellia pseudoproteus]